MECGLRISDGVSPELRRPRTGGQCPCRTNSWRDSSGCPDHCDQSHHLSGSFWNDFCKKKPQLYHIGDSLPVHVVVYIALIVLTIIVQATAILDDTNGGKIKGIVGEEVEIPCSLSSEENDCSGVHSVKWYQNGNRVYVHSTIYGYSLAEGRFQPGRAEFMANNTPPVLRIYPVQLADEGAYRCDVTYVSLKSGCPTVSHADIFTLAKPNSPEILLEDDEDADGEVDSRVTATVIGPFHEDDVVSLTCEVAGGKPAAQVTWWNGSQSMGGFFSEDTEEDGTGTGRNTIRLRVSRADLLARYDCQATHETLEGALVSWIQMDVYVPPQKIEFKGSDAVLEGDTVTLTCNAFHARPAATITWYNGSEPLSEQPTVTVQSEKGGTFASYSTLTFSATKFDDEDAISCEASNKAMDDGRRDPLTEAVTLTVFYAPIVKLQPDKDELELNESSTLRLECTFEANPANISSVVWMRNGKRIVEDDSSHGSDHKTTGSSDENGENLDGLSSNDREGEDNEDNADNSGNGQVVKEGSFPLVIRNISRKEAGEYTCMVANIAGSEISENTVNVSVLYPPEVRFIMFPTMAVEYDTNVTLQCEIEDANPEEITSVRWYRNGEVFNETDETTLRLHEVERTQHGNYSCQAENRVGWGEVSHGIHLDVLYPPGRARISHIPILIIKGQPVTLFCGVDEPGNPPVSEYIWKLGEFFISDVDSYNWTIENPKLQSQDTYMCIPKNAAGEGTPGTVDLDVNAPPHFITPLPENHGALETATDISLTCQVECDPRCTIEWLKDGQLLDVENVLGNGNGRNDDDDPDGGNGNGKDGLENETSDKNNGRPLYDDDDEEDEDAGNNDAGDRETLYSVKISHLPPNLRSGHFASVVSTLRWNMTAWPNRRLHRVENNANYTCRSGSNLAGIGVSSTTVFHVEYPPENITLSTKEIVVVEGNASSSVICHAEGYPPVSYLWNYNGKIVSSFQELRFDYPASRDRSGVYTCSISNSHGNLSADLILNVLYKPKCNLMAKMEEGIGTVLICDAVANPSFVDFTWLLGNTTVEDGIHTEGVVSRLTDVRAGGNYICIVNNSVGQSEVCETELQGAEGALIAGFTDNRLIIIITVVSAIVIVLIIVGIIIILVMKRRSAIGKYTNRMDLEQRENPEGHSQPEVKRTAKPGRKPGVVTFKRVDADHNVNRAQGAEAGKRRPGETSSGPGSGGERAFYENLPFHGLQPAPNKEPIETLERPVPAPRDYSPTKMRHIYQNLLLPLRASKTNPTLTQTSESPSGAPPPSCQQPSVPPPLPPSSLSSSSSHYGTPRDGVVYADLALSAGQGVKRRDRPTEYAVLTFCRDNTASEV